MIEEIKNKLKNDINCILTPEELKVLYEIDSDHLDLELNELRNTRNNFYNDLIQIFSPKAVAQTEKDITEDTVVLIDNLYFDGTQPTYNLRYAYGNIIVDDDNYRKLENLERVYKDINLTDIDKDSIIDGLDNLEYVNRLQLSATIRNTITLPYTLYLTIRGVVSDVTLKRIPNLPSSLKKLEVDDFVERLDKNYLPEGLKELDVSYFCELRGDEFPSSLEKLSFNINASDKVDIKNLSLSVKELKLFSIDESKIKDLDYMFRNMKNLENLFIKDANIMNCRLPEGLKKLELEGGSLTLDNVSIPKSLEELLVPFAYNIDINNTMMDLPNLKLLSVGEYIDLKIFKLPEKIDYVSITNSFLPTSLLNVDLEFLIKYKGIRMPEHIWNLYRAGVRYIERLVVLSDLQSAFSEDELIPKSGFMSFNLNEVTIKRNSKNIIEDIDSIIKQIDEEKEEEFDKKKTKVLFKNNIIGIV